MNAAAMNITIVTVLIVKHRVSAPGSDDSAQTDDSQTEARTRQQHAATDPADTPEGDD